MKLSQFSLTALAATTATSFLIPSTVTLSELKADGFKALEAGISRPWTFIKEELNVPKKPKATEAGHRYPTLPVPPMLSPEKILRGEDDTFELVSFQYTRPAHGARVNSLTVPLHPGRHEYANKTISLTFETVENDSILTMNDLVVFPRPAGPTRHFCAPVNSSDNTTTEHCLQFTVAQNVTRTVGLTGTIHQAVDIYDLTMAVYDAEEMDGVVDTLVIRVLRWEAGNLDVVVVNIAPKDAPLIPIFPVSRPVVTSLDKLKALLSGMSESRLLGSSGCHRGLYRGPSPKGVYRGPSPILRRPIITTTTTPLTHHRCPSTSPFCRYGATSPTQMSTFRYSFNHHHRHERPHGFAAFMHAMVFTILVPALIGIAAGIMASILGLLAGTLVSYCWIRFVRGGRRGDASASSSPSFSDEKVLLVAKDEEGGVAVSARSRLMQEFSGRSDGVAGYAGGRAEVANAEEEELPVYVCPPGYVEKE